MSVYLAEHPPRSLQFYRHRKVNRVTGQVGASGAVVVHTAESMIDLVLPDDGAEGVARYISTRTDPGSYHSVVDSDTTVRVGEYEWQMFGEGEGGNRWALHLSFACRTDQWASGPKWWTDLAIRRAAVEARSMSDWHVSQGNPPIPAHRITAEQYRRGAAGFISHAEVDPGRRTDPGEHFPWTQFLEAYQTTAEAADGDDDMALSDTQKRTLLRAAIRDAYELTNGPNPREPKRRDLNEWVKWHNENGADDGRTIAVIEHLLLTEQDNGR